MNLRRTPRWLVAALTLLVAGLLAWWLVWSREILVELPDGGRVRLLGTTYGVEHRFSGGSTWVKLIQRWISPRRALQLGYRSYLHQSPGTNLVIWTYWRFPLTNPPLFAAAVADDRGMESFLAVPAVTSSVPGRSEAVVAWQFNNFPRRLAVVRLRFYEVDANHRSHFLAEMAVPNPVRVTVPPWEAPRAPVTVQSGGFEFTLIELTGGDAGRERARTGQAFASPQTSAKFIVESKTQPGRQWRVRRFEGASAAGNLFVVRVPRTSGTGNIITASTDQVLWPEDGSWRIAAEFSPESDFPADQTWTFRNVPLRPGDSTVLSNLAVTVQGITLTNLSVLMLHPTQLQPSLTLRNVKVDLRFTPSIPGVRVDLIEASDERGRRLDFNSSYEFPPGTYSTLVGAPSDPQAVDLTFAIRPSHTVDFLVTPTFVNSNAPSTFPRSAGAATNPAR